LWLLARTPQITEALRADFLERITSLGFDAGQLVWLDKSGDSTDAEISKTDSLARRNADV